MSRRQTFRQRYVAICLLAWFVGDIGAHLISGLYRAPDRAGVAIGATENSGTLPGEEHSGCAIPDHGDFFCHHHHLLAILSPVRLGITLAAQRQTPSLPDTSTPHTLLVARSVRAPPSA